MTHEQLYKEALQILSDTKPGSYIGDPRPVDGRIARALADIFTDVYSETIEYIHDGGPFNWVEAMIEVRRWREQLAAAPAYHTRPTGPGLWLCYPDGTGPHWMKPQSINLTAEDISDGAPFCTAGVYGPLPAEKPA